MGIKYNWYKAYVGMACNPKLKLVAVRAGVSHSQAVHFWLYLLEFACQAHPRGSLRNFDCDVADIDLGMTPESCKNMMLELEKIKLVDKRSIAKWKAAQDNSTQRMRHFRNTEEGIEEQEKNTVTTRHIPVTKRHQERERELDKELEKKKEKISEKEKYIAPRRPAVPNGRGRGGKGKAAAAPPPDSERNSENAERREAAYADLARQDAECADPPVPEASALPAAWPDDPVSLAAAIWNRHLPDRQHIRLASMTDNGRSYFSHCLRKLFPTPRSWWDYCDQFGRVPYLAGANASGWAADWRFALQEANRDRVLSHGFGAPTERVVFLHQNLSPPGAGESAAPPHRLTAWQEFHRQLAAIIGARDWQAWCRGWRLRDTDGAALCMILPSRFIRDKVQERYREAVEVAALDAFGWDGEVRLEVATTPPAEQGSEGYIAIAGPS